MTQAIALYEKPTFPAVAEFEKRVALITVVDQDTFDLATEDIRYFKEIGATWEAERVRRKQPIDAIVQQLQADFMPVINGAKKAESDIKAMQKTFLVAEEKKRVDAQREANRVAEMARALAEKTAAQLVASGKIQQAAAVETAAAMIVPITVAPTAVKSKGTSTPKKWHGRAIDFRALMTYVAEHPEYHQFFEFQQSALDRAIHAANGKLVLPGVENYEDFDIRVGK